MNTPIVVDTPEGLRALCDRLLREPVAAVDTEFVWERTYYPVLGLVQIATSDRSCWLIDPVGLKDIKPFGAVLSSPDVVKIFHDAQQDLVILNQTTGAFPKRVFDTRLAAGFADLSSSISLKNLLEDQLGIHLEKSETRSNWVRRPLDEKQVTYAADDVLYLPELREKLIEGCFTDETRRWQAEEMTQFDDPTRYREKTPEEAWQRVKGIHALRPEQMPVLKALAAWRESLARMRDRPRSFLVNDAALIELAIRQPKTAEGVYAVHGVGARIPARDIQEAVAAIHEASARGPEPLAMGRAMPYSHAELKAKEDRLLGVIAERCRALGLDPALIASRRDAGQWILATDEERRSLPMANGWRRAFYAEIETSTDSVKG